MEAVSARPTKADITKADIFQRAGEKTPVANAPAVLYQGQGGMLGIFTLPRYAADHSEASFWRVGYLVK